MKQLYLDYTAPEFLSQAVRELKVRGAGWKKLSQAVRESGPPSGDTAETEFLAQEVPELVASIPWEHHANLLARLTDPAARLYYLCATTLLLR
jgi:hypothetical protein